MKAAPTTRRLPQVHSTFLDDERLQKTRVKDCMRTQRDFLGRAQHSAGLGGSLPPPNVEFRSRTFIAGLLGLAVFGVGAAWAQPSAGVNGVPSGPVPTVPTPTAPPSASVVPSAPMAPGSPAAPPATVPPSQAPGSAAPVPTPTVTPAPVTVPPPPPAGLPNPQVDVNAGPAAAAGGPASLSVQGVSPAVEQTTRVPGAAVPDAMPEAPTAASPIAQSPVVPLPRASTESGPAPTPLGESETSELGAFEYAVVVDANYSVSSSHRDAVAPAHRSFVWTGADGGISNGFALEWFGADLAYRYESVSAHTSLRFGDGAKWFLRDRASGAGLVPLAEAYLSWSPLQQLAVDLGQFRTSIGAESYDSFRNLNYSQGAMFGLLQPWWHTGVRVRATLGSAVSVEGMVVNGANTTFDEDDAPSGGLRVTVRPSSTASIQLGGYRTFDTAKDTSGYDTVADAVLRLQVGPLQVLATGMLNQVAEDPLPFSTSTSSEDDRAQPRGGVSWGAGGALAYRLHDLVQLAGRYEYVSDPKGLKVGADGARARLQTATLTVDLNPFEAVSGLAVRWDNRVEWSNRDLFVNTTEDPSRRWFGSTLGVVFHTDAQ